MFLKYKLHLEQGRYGPSVDRVHGAQRRLLCYIITITNTNRGPRFHLFLKYMGSEAFTSQRNRVHSKCIHYT